MMKALYFSIMLFFVSCSTTPTHNKSMKSKTISISMKSPKLRFSGVSFVKFNNSKVNMNIKILNAPNIRISIYKDVCINGICLSKKEFNYKYFNYRYPDSLLENIIKARPIFKALNIKRNKKGFTQTIAKITYVVNGKHTVFRDKYHHILIKTKELND